MKKNSSFTLIIVLVALLGVFALVKFTGNSGRSKSFLESLVEIDKEAVTKVEILSPADTTLLEKQGDSWKVNKEKAGDADVISSMLNTLETIKPSRLAARSQDSWKDFQVDETGTRVIVYEGSKKTLDIVLGRFNVEGQRQYMSYVRLYEDEDVYVAKDFMKMSVGSRGVDYRNDDILRLNKDSISAVSFNYPDSAFRLDKADQGWIIGESAADSATVAKYLQSLNFVTSRNFAEQSGAALMDVSYELSNGEDVQVSGYANNGITSSFNEEEYWEDKNAFDKVFKGASHFLGSGD
ncbi:MAG: DUF4340 domain-containing protein [Cyclobacteriaceae bacterium]